MCSWSWLRYKKRLGFARYLTGLNWKQSNDESTDGEYQLLDHSCYGPILDYDYDTVRYRTTKRYESNRFHTTTKALINSKMEYCKK